MGIRLLQHAHSCMVVSNSTAALRTDREIRPNQTKSNQIKPKNPTQAGRGTGPWFSALAASAALRRRCFGRVPSPSAPLSSRRICWLDDGLLPRLASPAACPLPETARRPPSPPAAGPRPPRRPSPSFLVHPQDLVSGPQPLRGAYRPKLEWLTIISALFCPFRLFSAHFC